MFVWKHAIIAFKSLTEDNLRIPWIMTTRNNRRGTSQNVLVDCHNSSSNVKKTIEFYTDYDALPPSRPLVTKPDGV